MRFCGIKLHNSCLCVIVLAGEQGRVSVTVTASETVSASQPWGTSSIGTVLTVAVPQYFVLPGTPSATSQLKLYPLSIIKRRLSNLRGVNVEDIGQIPRSFMIPCFHVVS